MFASGASAKSGQGLSAASPANRAIGVAPSELLSLGSNGPGVAKVQRAVGVAADGIFGPRTDRGRAQVPVAQRPRGRRHRGRAHLDRAVRRAGDRRLARRPDKPQYRFAVEKADATEVEKVAPKLEGKGAVAKIELRTVADASAEEPKAEEPKRSPAEPRREGRGGPGPAPVADTGPSTVSTSCGSDRLIRPVRGGTVTGDFGESRPGHRHGGIDIAAPTGTRIVAAACGVVTAAGWQSGYGNMVCVKHSASLTTCYAHMSRIGVARRPVGAPGPADRLRRLDGQLVGAARSLRDARRTAARRIRRRTCRGRRACARRMRQEEKTSPVDDHAQPYDHYAAVVLVGFDGSFGSDDDNGKQ